METQAYMKEKKIPDLMEKVVATMLIHQGPDPLSDVIYTLCVQEGVTPPAECPKPVPRAETKKQPEKEQPKKVDPREEALNKVAAEKEKKKKDADEGASFASAF